MKVKEKTDMSYYEYLEILQRVSANCRSFQIKVMKRVYENFDIYKLKNKLDRQIEHYDRLLSANK
ncbi:MAG: hypothetical protein ACFE9S_11725 [Candidatus Hermodarchaeota archaeon]